jgi:hypothetical protein
MQQVGSVQSEHIIPLGDLAPYQEDKVLQEPVKEIERSSDPVILVIEDEGSMSSLYADILTDEIPEDSVYIVGPRIETVIAQHIKTEEGNSQQSADLGCAMIRKLYAEGRRPDLLFVDGLFGGGRLEKVVRVARLAGIPNIIVQSADGGEEMGRRVEVMKQSYVPTHHHRSSTIERLPKPFNLDRMFGKIEEVKAAIVH